MSVWEEEAIKPRWENDCNRNICETWAFTPPFCWWFSKTWFPRLGEYYLDCSKLRSMTTFAQIDISGKVTLCFLTQLNKSVKKHGLFMVRLNSRPCRENIIIGILCNNKLTNIQYWKQKKPGQHDDKPFKEVVCKTIKDLRRWREDVARKKLVVLKPSRDEVCQKQFCDCIF